MATFERISSTVCVLFCLLLATESRVYEPNASLLYGQTDAALAFRGGVLKDKAFGFGNEGTLDFGLACEPTPYSSDIGVPDLWFLVCSALEEREIREIGRSSLNQVCQKLQYPDEAEKNFSMICQAIPMELFSQSHLGNYWKAYHHFDKDAFLRFLLLQCPREIPNKTKARVTEVQCQGRLVLMNNNGRSHLSKDERALLPIYKVFLLVWVVLLALWIANWFKFRQFSNHLHQLFFVAPSFKFLLLTLSLVWWEVIAATGHENKSLQMCRDMVHSTQVAMLFMTMMLASEGWCVLRPTIRNIHCVLIPVLFLVFLGSAICVIWVHDYFMVFAVCSIIFVICRAHKWCSINNKCLLRLLLLNMRYIREKQLRFHDISIIKQLQEKRNIYVRLRLVCDVYTAVFVLGVTMASFLTEFTWVQMLAVEIPELMVFMSLGLIFRLRDFAPYENIEVIQPKEDSVVILLPFPNDKWPKRQKLALGKPVHSCSEYCEEDGCEDKTGKL